MRAETLICLGKCSPILTKSRKSQQGLVTRFEILELLQMDRQRGEGNRRISTSFRSERAETRGRFQNLFFAIWHTSLSSLFIILGMSYISFFTDAPSWPPP
jgi:hypothetical protein